MYRFSFVLFCTLIALGCRDKNATTVVFDIDHAAGRAVYIETIPYTNETVRVLDSVSIPPGGSARVKLQIRDVEERPLRLRVTDTDIRIVFFNDAAEIRIRGNILKPREYSIENSPGTTILDQFLALQKEQGREWEKVTQEVQRLQAGGIAGPRMDSLLRLQDKFLAEFFERYRRFADTVSHPGVFLYVYNKADFGKDYAALKAFMERAAKRFPDHQRIQELVRETRNFLKVFEEEYHVGDLLPSAELPDSSGKMVSTSRAGRYVFLDMWASWCGPCVRFDRPKSEARRKFPAEKLEIISIGLEPEKEFWKAHIRRHEAEWTQLIDEKVWEGETLRVFRIDSIPFNFLVDPRGRIVRKAIPADSLVAVLSETLR
ncbi:MAG TPA: TlpA disulfide reductase family protein [Chitinophagaceae bacterium]|nr:TlpA disulfide reductase family protein [Chitinophagaceae bacterium]